MRMKMSEAKYKADARYRKKAYEQIAFIVRRDGEMNGDCIRTHAEAMGESMNSFLKRAVAETIERDKTKTES